MCGMSFERRLEFISEGLPIIYGSAKSLLAASKVLEESAREAAILEGHAIEECSKALILIDIVRCPKKQISSRIGPMIKWFYDHLARILYADSQGKKPVTFADLQLYTDRSRRTHYLEGDYGEFIMPNWELYQRESTLYADVFGNENDEPNWHNPLPRTSFGFDWWTPTAFRITDALEAIGAFSTEGLKIMNSVWGHVDFAGDLHWRITEELCQK